ncbi:MAG: EamA family transporter [Chloroflexota bacterium]
MPLWFLFAVTTALLWGVGQVLAKRGLEFASPLLNNVLAALFTLVLYVPIALAGGVDLGRLPVALLFGLLSAVGLQAYPYALSKGPVSVTGTIIACSPTVTVLLAAAFLAEKVELWQGVAIGLAIGGSILLASSGRGLSDRWRLDWLAWGGTAAAVIGAADFFIKVGIERTNVFTFMLAAALAEVPVVLLLFALDHKGRRWPTASVGALLPTLLGVLALVSGGVTLNLAFANGPASLVSPLSASFVAFSALLAVVFLRERLNRLQGLGLGMAALAVIGLGLS